MLLVSRIKKKVANPEVSYPDTTVLGCTCMYYVLAAFGKQTSITFGDFTVPVYVHTYYNGA